MNRTEKTFRDRLLDIEKTNATYKEKYERQVKEMTEQKLTGLKKMQIIGFLGMSVCLGVLFGTLAVIIPKGFPLWGRAGFAIGSVFSLAFAVLYLLILKKGSINLKKDNMDLAWTGWGLVIIIGTLALVFSPNLPDKISGVHWLVSCLFYLIAAGVFLLRAFIERSEVNTREKLLEIEYRLADLAEKMENKENK